MKKVNRSICFTLCSERLPETSGEYICVTENRSVHRLPYSSAHKLFNAIDNGKWPVVEYAIPVKAWAEIPEWIKD